MRFVTTAPEIPSFAREKLLCPVRNCKTPLLEEDRVAGAYARQVPRPDADAVTRHYLSSYAASDPAPRIVCSKGRSKPLSILERSREMCTSMTLVCGSK